MVDVCTIDRPLAYYVVLYSRVYPYELVHIRYASVSFPPLVTIAVTYGVSVSHVRRYDR